MRAKIVFNFPCSLLGTHCEIFATYNAKNDNSMNELHLRLFISVRCRRRRSGLGDWGAASDNQGL